MRERVLIEAIYVLGSRIALSTPISREGGMVFVCV